MEYPHINPHIQEAELVEHFTLTKEERFLLPQLRKKTNIIGFAVLLKSFIFLGYPLRSKEDVPASVVTYIGQQLKLNPNLFSDYTWKDSNWKTHLSIIRKFTGFHSGSADSFQELMRWLIAEANNYPSRSKIFFAAIKRCRQLCIELPTENELQRLVNSAWRQYLDIVCQKISETLSTENKEKIDRCLNQGNDDRDQYEWMKANPGKIGIKNLLTEIKRLQFVNSCNIKAGVHLKDVPHDMLELLYERAAPETAYQINQHHPNYRYALMAAFLHFRRMELTDNIIDIFLHLINRIEKKADTKLEQELAKSIKTIYKKRELLYKIAKVSTQNPKGTVEGVLFPIIGKEIFEQIVDEYEGQELRYENTQVIEKKKKYTGSYRRMVKPILEILVFRTNNPSRRPLITSVDIVKKYLDKKHVYYPEDEDIPDELLTDAWDELIAENGDDSIKVVKHYFELYVLQTLEKTLRNKEIWVEDSYRYRNPDQDLPQDWTKKCKGYCSKHKIPYKAEDFIDPIKDELTSSLAKANEFFGRKEDVYIYYPGNGDKGFFRIPKITKGPEHPIFQEIKQKAINRWGILDLADILLEADKQVNFVRFFYSTAQRQILTSDEIRERLLLSLLGRGTGIGLKRIHAAAKPSFSYDDLIYFNKRFMHVDSVREAIAALVNRIIEVRNPEIWKSTTSCTSDGKYIGSWEQNLIAQWNPHYQECGIMMYSMLDKHSAGIHAQIRKGTEVSAMITALLNHDTAMTIGSNTVDSHGQSELGFAFCKFLSIELHPWLKRMKNERLYLPDPNTKNTFSNLTGVLARPIKWDLAHEYYNDMIRHVVAAKEKTAPVDSLLRRFNRNNPANQTYKGFLEIGKALKTIHDCKFLTSEAYRKKIHAERNIVESWNSVIDFICYGGKSEVQSNDPIAQELTILGLHLLQNALVLVNTIMVERVAEENGYVPQIQQATDDVTITPLFTSNVNPYGDIHIDLNKPSFLEGH